MIKVEKTEKTEKINHYKQIVSYKLYLKTQYSNITTSYDVVIYLFFYCACIFLVQTAINLTKFIIRLVLPLPTLVK